MRPDLYTLEDLGLDRLEGVAVFVRVDFNVPLADGRVGDDTRLREAVPTLEELAGAGARLVLASHCGRPKGKVDPKLSLRPVGERLAKLLGRPVPFAEDAIGEPARSVVAQLGPGGVCLLENLRFHPGEKANDAGFADALASLAEAFVGDAFGTAHRAHASVVGVAERLGRKAAGRLMLREVEALGRLLGEPARPFVAILGGAKISDKAEALGNLLPRLDQVFLGGGMANTFLAARGLDLVDSLVESEGIETARRIEEEAQEKGIELVLPEEVVVTDDLDDPHEVATVAVDAIPPGRRAVDVGEGFRRRLREALRHAETVFWNGPMGVFEKERFAAGTSAVAAAVADCPGYTVIGGGETVAAARRAGVTERIDHVSTGGGASLDLLAGKELPGVEVLRRSR